MNIVLDTNCLLMSLSRRSRYYPVWRDFVDGKYTLWNTKGSVPLCTFPKIEVIDIDEFLSILR